MDERAFAREISRMEVALKRAWPLLRPLVRRHLSRRCRRCVLSENYAPLNPSGLCRLCAETPAPPTQPAAPISGGPNAADDLFAEASARSTGLYDAMLLLSGGKDSAYLLHRLRQQHPRLRLLAVLVNNGFMSPFALSNAEAVRRRFDVDLCEVRTPLSFVREVFRWGLTHLERQRGYSLVDLLDGQMTYDSALNLAATMQIPLVITGISKVQSEQVFGAGVWEFASEGPDLATPGGAPREEAFADSQGCRWYRAERWPVERRPRFVMPFVLWDPTERFLLEQVERLRLLPRGRTSPLATNNALIPVIGLVEVARFGYSSFEVEFARMVREGKSERGWWLNLFESLEYAAKTGRLLGATVTATLQALDLTPEQLGLQMGA